MKTISVSDLKAHLSAELRKVKAGEELVVLEHRRPVAIVRPYRGEALVLREPAAVYTPTRLVSLTSADPAEFLSEERSERW
ncbi:MAG: type II toxin-antitoxin system Phd/YefM family antitoxin [Spirochaetota bacterium]